MNQAYPHARCGGIVATDTCNKCGKCGDTLFEPKGDGFVVWFEGDAALESTKKAPRFKYVEPEEEENGIAPETKPPVVMYLMLARQLTAEATELFDSSRDLYAQSGCTEPQPELRRKREGFNRAMEAFMDKWNRYQLAVYEGDEEVIKDAEWGKQKWGKKEWATTIHEDVQELRGMLTEFWQTFLSCVDAKKS